MSSSCRSAFITARFSTLYSQGPVKTNRLCALGSMPARTVRSTTPDGGRIPTSFACSLRAGAGSEAMYRSTSGRTESGLNAPTRK